MFASYTYPSNTSAGRADSVTGAVLRERDMRLGLCRQTVFFCEVCLLAARPRATLVFRAVLGRFYKYWFVLQFTTFAVSSHFLHEGCYAIVPEVFIDGN